MSVAADWILQNGRVITLDRRRPAATELAITGRRIVATGARGDVRAWRDRRTRVVDLGGATVIPGLVDAHAHLDREGLKRIYPSLERCRSIADVQAVIRRLAATRPRGAWITTMPLGMPPFYLDPSAGLVERRWPSRADLDVAAPDHPVYIRGIWGYWNRPPVHSIANSLALARAGVTRDTAPPRGVEIVKDAAGEPTGLFMEHNLIQVIEFTLMKTAPWAGFVESANDRGDYARQAELAARSGLRVNTLVTLCLPEVLDIWEAIAARTPIRDLRWVLVHLHVATSSQMARIRRLGAVATTKSDQLSLALGGRRAGAPRRRGGEPHPASEPGSARCSIRDRQQRQSVAGAHRGCRTAGHDDRPGARSRRATLARAGSPCADSGRRQGDLRRARTWGIGPGPRGGPRRARSRSAYGALPRPGRDHGAPDHGGWAGRARRALATGSPASPSARS